jgi:hypothetical protein
MQKTKQKPLAGFAESIPPGQKINRLPELGGYQNGIKERIGVIGHQ